MKQDLSSYQVNSSYEDRYDVGTGVVIVYCDDIRVDINARIKSWIEQGYEPWVMINGSQDYTGGYVMGHYDGKKHFDEIQQEADGSYKRMFSQGAYMVPNPNWLQYLKDLIRRAIDAGARGVVPEEPETWMSGGYSPAFKEAWRQEYGTEWVDPATNETTRWMARRLMAYLYERHLHEIHKFVKSYDPSVKSIIAAHSLINYADLGIVYPHSKTARIPILDGYIAQVWSDTARSHYFDPTQDGEIVEGTFYKGFLEYNYFWNLMRGTGKDLMFLLDPKSDSESFTWKEYRNWYEQTVIAATMFDIADYEVLPWPERFFVPDNPAEYKTVFLTTVRAMLDLKNHPGDYKSSIAMLVSDTLMWTSPRARRGRSSDPHDSTIGIYAITSPLLRDGVPLDLVPVERAGEAGYLDRYKLIFMSYESWLPEFKEYQDAIVDWVKKGGVLAFIGGSQYADIQGSWWKEMNIAEPLDALFDDSGVEREGTQIQARSDTLISADNSHPLVKKLGKVRSLPGCDHVYLYDCPSAHSIYGIWGPEDSPVVFEQEVGEGLVFFAGLPPSFLARSREGAEIVRGICEYLSAKADMPYEEKDLISVKRGPYHTAYATRDGVSLKGPFIDLLDANLPLVEQKKLDADQYAFLFEVSPLPKHVQVLYSSSIIGDVVYEPNKTSCQVAGTFTTVGVTTIYSPRLDPKSVSAKDSGTKENVLVDQLWNESRRTLTVKYDHPARRHKVDIVVTW